jgi:hypothetical protein
MASRKKSERVLRKRPHKLLANIERTASPVHDDDGEDHELHGGDDLDKLDNHEDPDYLENSESSDDAKPATKKRKRRTLFSHRRNDMRGVPKWSPEAWVKQREKLPEVVFGFGKNADKIVNILWKQAEDADKNRVQKIDHSNAPPFTEFD